MKLIVGPAGLLTVDIETPLSSTVDSITRFLTEKGTNWNEALNRLADLGCLEYELLLGMDGCEGQSRPLQTVIHVSGKPETPLASTAMKLFATDREKVSLLGWRICDRQQNVPKELETARWVETTVGRVLIFVCYDGSLMRDRELPGATIRAVRSHFNRKATEANPRYILLATHNLKPNKSPRSGIPGFIDSLACLGRRWNSATVITTMFAPHADLEKIGGKDYFPVTGPSAEAVATMLVIDQALDD